MKRVLALLAVVALGAACNARNEDQAATTRTTGMGIGLPNAPTASREAPIAPPPPAPVAGYPEERRFFGGPAHAGGTTGKESSTSLDGKNGVGAGPGSMNDPAAASRALGGGGDGAQQRPMHHRR